VDIIPFMADPLWRRCISESFGTFVLVFAGTGAIVVNDLRGGALGHVGVAIAFGLVVLALIYALGERSGCHLNPAVTFGFAVAGRFPWRQAAQYIAAQLAGAFAASGFLKAIYPEHPTLGATLPGGTMAASLAFELLLTLILMLIILSVSSGAKEKGILAGVAIGSTIGFMAMFAGPESGASMNPARSLAPAIVSGKLDHLWIYLVAPIVGAAAAVPLCKLIHGPGDCCPSHPFPRRHRERQADRTVRLRRE